MKIFSPPVEHLGRMVLVFAAGVAGFLGLRYFAVPEGFGQYGHYRGPVLEEVRSLPVVFAGRAACETCHTDISESLDKGRHKRVNCEACHGPLGKHAEDPDALKPQKPVTGQLCARCHEANASKPRAFPQVNSQEHSGGESCGTCHNPHQPKVG